MVNWKYSSEEHEELVYPEKDGELMRKLLVEGGYTDTVVEENEEDIENVVNKYIENKQSPLERFHFHYSGKIAFICHYESTVSIFRSWYL